MEIETGGRREDPDEDCVDDLEDEGGRPGFELLVHFSVTGTGAVGRAEIGAIDEVADKLETEPMMGPPRDNGKDDSELVANPLDLWRDTGYGDSDDNGNVDDDDDNEELEEGGALLRDMEPLIGPFECRSD